MTNRLTINLPDVLMEAVRQYQQAAGLKSAAAAATILLVYGINAASLEGEPASFGGSRAADDALWQEFLDAGEPGEFVDWLIGKIRQSWGGQREGAFGREAKD